MRLFGLGKKSLKMNCDYKADNLGTRFKSMDFMNDQSFQNAWHKASEAAMPGWKNQVPDIRWRTHIAIWAAQHGLTLEGDFVECGVYTGLLSLSICHHLKFNKVARKFWLFDTWEGIPTDGLSGKELLHAEYCNQEIYQHAENSLLGTVKQAFKPFPNCHLVQGILPDTLKTVPLKQIAYLSIDLNTAVVEGQCLEYLWPKLTKGAFVVLDDYGWVQCAQQKKVMDTFAKAHGKSIVTLPTGQGLLVK